MRIAFIFLITFIVFTAGCKIDSNQLKEITKDDLIGEWEIYHALRNGKVTKSLENGNFVFQADNLVSSNLFTNSNNLNFTYENSTITIEGDQNIDVLKIKDLKNDTLVLFSKLNVFNMEFYLVKK